MQQVKHANPPKAAASQNWFKNLLGGALHVTNVSQYPHFAQNYTDDLMFGFDAFGFHALPIQATATGTNKQEERETRYTHARMLMRMHMNMHTLMHTHTHKHKHTNLV